MSVKLSKQIRPHLKPEARSCALNCAAAPGRNSKKNCASPPAQGCRRMYQSSATRPPSLQTPGLGFGIA